MGFAKTLKLRFGAGDLDLPEIRKRYTSSSREEEEEEVDAQMYVPVRQSIREQNSHSSRRV